MRCFLVVEISLLDYYYRILGVPLQVIRPCASLEEIRRRTLGTFGV